MTFSSPSDDQKKQLIDLLGGLVGKRSKKLSPLTRDEFNEQYSKIIQCSHFWLNQKYYIQKNTIKLKQLYSSVCQLNNRIKKLSRDQKFDLDIEALSIDNMPLFLEEISKNLTIYQNILEKKVKPIKENKKSAKPRDKTAFSLKISKELLEIYSAITNRRPGIGRGSQSWVGYCADFVMDFYNIMQPPKSKGFIITKPTRANAIKQIQRYGQILKN